jgi:hypothetical protein
MGSGCVYVLTGTEISTVPSFKGGSSGGGSSIGAGVKIGIGSG